MTNESELEYLLRRATEEIDYAEICVDPTAAAVHRQLALLYARQVAEYGARPAMRIVPEPTLSAI